MKETKIVFKHFLERFPEVALPITLNSESHQNFSAENEPLPFPFIESYLLEENEEVTEFDEFVPCFRIPETYAFHAIVYWKAGLLSYEYLLATYSKEGVLLDKKVINGTKIFGNLLIQSVTILEDDWTIVIVEGASLADVEGKDDYYDASKSKVHKLELLPTGEIILLDKPDD